jgi:hypothetical protein
MSNAPTMADVERARWECQHAEIIEWMVESKGFTPNGAEKAFRSFVETQVFLVSQGLNPLRAVREWVK